jgi:hypothetical protein
MPAVTEVCYSSSKLALVTQSIGPLQTNGCAEGYNIYHERVPYDLGYKPYELVGR